MQKSVSPFLSKNKNLSINLFVQTVKSEIFSYPIVSD